MPFAVADVVRGKEDEVRIVSVDALQVRALELASGNVRPTAKPVAKKGDVPNLLAQAKTVHAQALAKMKAGDGRATLAACDRLGQLANQLSDAKRPNDAFRIWAAAKKLRRAVAPEQVGKTLPKEEQPALEDLEF
jgi:hypothetical protein